MNFLRYFVAVPDFCRSWSAFWTNEFSMLVAKTHFSANKKLMASVQGDNEINLTCLCPRKALPFLRVTVFVAPSIVQWCFQVVVNFLGLVCKCRSTCLAVLDYFFSPRKHWRLRRNACCSGVCAPSRGVLIQTHYVWVVPYGPAANWQVPAVTSASLRSCTGSRTDWLCDLKWAIYSYRTWNSQCVKLG